MSSSGSDRRDKGFRAERALANKLWALGFAVVRGGASGGGVRKRFVPDIVAMRNGKILIVEVKYRSKEEAIPIELERAKRLLDFAQRAGGEAFIAVKYGRREWRFIKLSEALQAANNCDCSRYIYIKPELIKRRGLTLRQVVESVFSEYMFI